MGVSSGRARALLVGARPKQWTKNVLVFLAPAAAGVLDQPDQAARSVVTFVAFCAAASGTYFLNDVADREADRHHPRKRHRPVAAGQVSVALAVTTGVVLVVASLVISTLARPELALVTGSYLALTTLYSVWLKHQAVVDLVAVASGFVLRAAAGAVAVDVPISSWFFIVASAASLFMVTGKRLAELREVESTSGPTRSTLEHYSVSYLTYVLAVATGIAILAYCLWAFEEADLRGSGGVWMELSAVPFTLGLLRYALLVDAGGGGEPEELVLGDVTLLVIGVLWAGLFGAAIYAG